MKMLSQARMAGAIGAGAGAGAAAGGLTKENINAFLSQSLEAYSTVAIQSQHMGNCASDSIQIIMFFSDYIGDYWRQIAVNEYNRLGDAVFRQPILEPTTFENIYENYILYSIQRFLRLVGVNPSRYRSGNKITFNQESGMLRRRGSEHNLYASQTGVSPTYGITCSLWIGKIAELQGRLRPENVEGYKSYNYTPDVYDGLREYIVGKVAPGSARQIASSGNFGIDLEYFQREFPTATPVGVQFFLIDNNGLFHTFTMVKVGGNWYIGDNEVGLLSPLTTYTDDDIFSSVISFDSLLEDYPNGTKHHLRRYVLNEKAIDVEYLGTEGTGVAYEGAVERPEIEWARRRYFIYIPPAARGGKQKKRKQRKTRRHKKV